MSQNDNGPTILLDRSPCIYAATGVARYVNRLQGSLVDLGARVIPFQPFADGSLAAPSMKKRFGSLLADWVLTPRGMRHLFSKHSPSLIHYTHTPLSLAAPRSVVTVYDFNILHARDDFSAYSRLAFNRRLQTLDRAAAVITISDFVRSELVQRFPSWSRKTTTVYLGTNFEREAPRTNQDKKRVFLYVGGIGPNKNLKCAITAFVEAARGAPDHWDFNIIGPIINAAYHRELLQLVDVLQAGNKIHFLGVLTDEQVAEHYRSSFGLLFISLREGFGFPVVEAQANGCLCVVSNTTCLPEIGGDGCLYVDPVDGPSVAHALQAAMTGSAPVADLVRAGLHNAKRFSWERCGRETLAVYDAVLHQKFS